MAKRLSKPVPDEESAPQNESEYTVVARRYRPQQFSDLVGQEPVARALTNAIQSNRVAHAYLFTGARGVGKTSAARILAKALNCVNGPTPTPCDKCEICQAITSGEDIDVLEIDGASNNGVEEVRTIRQNVATRPSRTRYKIYIIDEVHMLSKAAFNALLKTLEEPPPHVKFIFATTEVQKIPITILSRCQRFDFAGIGAAKILERLKQVVAAEKMQADDEALQIVARRAGGSMRDAQSLLDQLLAFGSEKLTAEGVHQLLGTATDDRILDLVNSVMDRNIQQAISILGTASDEGAQLGELLDQLIDYWRGLMLISCAGSDYGDVNLSQKAKETAVRHAQLLTLDSVLAGLDILTTTKSRLRGTNNALVLLEMALVRLAKLEELIPIAQLTQMLSQTGVNSLSNLVKSSQTAQPKANPGAEPAKKNDLNKSGTAPNQTNGKPNPIPQTLSPQPLDASNLEEIWAQARAKVGTVLATHLEKSNLPAIFGPKALVLRFPFGYNHSKQYCEQPENVRWVEEALREVTGQGWSVKIEVEPPPPKGEETVSQPAAMSRRQRREELMKIPLLQRAEDVLGARLQDFHADFGVEQPGIDVNDSTDSTET
jgi:DNA polymerase-3 subunit gamma/tau